MLTPSLLSEEQHTELQMSILAYLNAQGLSKSLETLALESGLSLPLNAESESFSGLLERRWSSVTKLQKKVSDMQQRKPKTVTVPLELESRALVGHRKAVQCVAFHPAHDWLASGSDDGSIRVWDIDSGACLQVLQGHSRGIQSLAWAPSGKYLASGSSDATAKLWHDDGDSLSCIKTLIGHDDSVTCTVFSKDSQTLFTGSKDESIRVWAVKTGICNQTLSHDDWVRCVDISPQHPFLASGYNNSISVWNTETADKIADLRGHSHIIECVKFLPTGAIPGEARKNSESNGHYLASGSRDKLIIVWDLRTQQALRTLSGHDNWIRDLAFYQDTFLISVSEDKTLRFWDMDKEQQVKVIHKAHDRFITCNDSARGRIATGSLDDQVHLYIGKY